MRPFTGDLVAGWAEIKPLVLKVETELVNPLLLFSWTRKDALALGSKLRLLKCKINFRFYTLVINVNLTLKDLRFLSLKNDELAKYFS